jgi:manganese transport protein
MDKVRSTPRRPHLLTLLGPAFVAAVAYVDPGNVAANLSAGATYGYRLIWVLCLANGMAVIVQFLSAKLGLVTGRSLPELIGQSLSPWGRRAFWLQAALIAIATDLAEVVGGAIALRILFGLPLFWGGLIVGALSVLLLATHSRGERRFELVIVGLLVVITIGFMTGLARSDVDWGTAAEGLIPTFAGTGSVFLAASMLGATVMPHAIYLHSTVARNHHAQLSGTGRLRDLIGANRWDVLIALFLAGSVNVAMLVLAAASLTGQGEITIDGAYAAIRASLGPAVSLIFAVGLLASGLASTSVGAYAGVSVTEGLLRVKVPVLAIRVATLVPALVVLSVGVEPTAVLIVSQACLSFGIPFALIPLVRLTGSRQLMGSYANPPWFAAVAWLVVAAIIALNVVLLGLMALSPL